MIVLDLMMPAMDGVETLKRLRQNPVTAKIPVIFLTVKAEDAYNLTALGALAVIPKPFDPELITAQIAEILERHAPGSLEGAS